MIKRFFKSLHLKHDLPAPLLHSLAVIVRPKFHLSTVFFFSLPRVHFHNTSHSLRRIDLSTPEPFQSHFLHNKYRSCILSFTIFLIPSFLQLFHALFCAFSSSVSFSAKKFRTTWWCTYHRRRRARFSISTLFAHNFSYFSRLSIRISIILSNQSQEVRFSRIYLYI